MENKFTEIDATMVSEYASLFFSKEEVMIIMEFDPELFDDIAANKEFDVAYKRGKLKSEAKVRKSIMDLAVNGSSPAQTQAMEFIEKSKLDD